jgi:hypothetical protein
VHLQVGGPAAGALSAGAPLQALPLWEQQLLLRVPGRTSGTRSDARPLARPATAVAANLPFPGLTWRLVAWTQAPQLQGGGRCTYTLSPLGPLHPTPHPGASSPAAPSTHAGRGAVPSLLPGAAGPSAAVLQLHRQEHAGVQRGEAGGRWGGWARAGPAPPPAWGLGLSGSGLGPARCCCGPPLHLALPEQLLPPARHTTARAAAAEPRAAAPPLQAVELVVDRAYAAGEPVYAWCGPQPNSRLLINYGIVDELNPHDRLSLTVTLDRNGDPLYPAKRALLQALGLSPAQVGLGWARRGWARLGRGRGSGGGGGAEARLLTGCRQALDQPLLLLLLQPLATRCRVAAGCASAALEHPFTPPPLQETPPHTTHPACAELQSAARQAPAATAAALPSPGLRHRRQPPGGYPLRRRQGGAPALGQGCACCY